MQSLAVMVQKMIQNNGSIPQIARRAGISPSTLNRIVNGQVDPTAKTLTEIAFACGVELTFTTSSLSTPFAAQVVRSKMEPGYKVSKQNQVPVAEWANRLHRAAENSTELLTAAAKYGSPFLREDALRFAGKITLGQIASTGDAAGGLWAVSGAAGLSPDRDPFDELIGPTVLWVEDARTAGQILGDSRLKAVDRSWGVDLVVAEAHSDLFANFSEVDFVRFASPLQIILDCLPLKNFGEIAQAEILKIERCGDVESDT